jgi:hypothetical protein
MILLDDAQIEDARAGIERDVSGLAGFPVVVEPVSTPGRGIGFRFTAPDGPPDAGHDLETASVRSIVDDHMRRVARAYLG